MDDSAENVTTAHRTTGFLTGLRNWTLLINALMRLRCVEERDARAHHAPQMRLIDDQHLVFLTNRS
jgi:hypothetical protein